MNILVSISHKTYGVTTHKSFSRLEGISKFQSTDVQDSSVFGLKRNLSVNILFIAVCTN